MPRPKGSKNASPLQELCNSQIIIKKLDETQPSNNLSTNNEVRAAIRETRAKLNEIINILNAR